VSLYPSLTPEPTPALRLPRQRLGPNAAGFTDTSNVSDSPSQMSAHSWNISFAFDLPASGDCTVAGTGEEV
jgi:hypothetical protein